MTLAVLPKSKPKSCLKHLLCRELASAYSKSVKETPQQTLLQEFSRISKTSKT